MTIPTDWPSRQAGALVTDDHSPGGGVAATAAESTNRTAEVATALGVASAVANAAIHGVLTPAHLVEMPYLGVLFAVATVASVAVIIGLSARNEAVRRIAWYVGASVSAGEALAFVASRTVGLPGGYLEEWTGSYESALGLVSLGSEVVFLAVVVIWLHAKRAAADSR